MTVAVLGELTILSPAFAEAQEIVCLSAIPRCRDDLMAGPADGTIFVDHL